MKTAAHAHDRMVERTPLEAAHVDRLQASVDALGLDPGTYHVPLRGDGGVLHGYAQFKGVPNRKGPVLATVLSADMRPAGSDLTEMLRART